MAFWGYGMKLQRFGITPFLGFVILVILISFISAGTARGAFNTTLNVTKAGTGTGKVSRAAIHSGSIAASIVHIYMVD